MDINLNTDFVEFEGKKGRCERKKRNVKNEEQLKHISLEILWRIFVAGKHSEEEEEDWEAGAAKNLGRTQEVEIGAADVSI